MNNELKKMQREYLRKRLGIDGILMWKGEGMKIISQKKSLSYRYNKISKYYTGMFEQFGWGKTIEAEIKEEFKLFIENEGGDGDIDNPVTFNEKIAWLKIHGDNTLYTQLADKFAVRKYVNEKVGGGISHTDIWRMG